MVVLGLSFGPAFHILVSSDCCNTNRVVQVWGFGFSSYAEPPVLWCLQSAVSVLWQAGSLDVLPAQEHLLIQQAFLIDETVL